MCVECCGSLCRWGGVELFRKSAIAIGHPGVRGKQGTASFKGKFCAAAGFRRTGG